MWVVLKNWEGWPDCERTGTERGAGGGGGPFVLSGASC